MISKTILLDNVRKVSNFVNQMLNFKGEVIVRHDKYVVNGRSILGIMSLDLSQPIICEIEEYENQKWEINCKEFEVINEG